MDVSKYLDRIGFPSEGREDLKPTFQLLKTLHNLHQTHVPYENLDVMLGNKILMNIEHLYNKMVTQRRGGWCHELNGLFCWLLRQLKFNVEMAESNAWIGGKFNEAYDHMVLIVTIEEKDSDGNNISRRYLTDPGWGELKAHFDPILMDEEVSQVSRQTNGIYTLSLKDSNNENNQTWMLYYKPLDSTEDVVTVHRFFTRICSLEDFQQGADRFQFNEDGSYSSLYTTPIVLMKTPGGSSGRLLVGNKYNEYEDMSSVQKKKNESESRANLSQEELRNIFRTKFGIIFTEKEMSVDLFKNRKDIIPQDMDVASAGVSCCM